MNKTLIVEHVAKQFAKTIAVKDVSFEVSAGEIFALLGPNGAGKTTTIRMILDILKPDKGSITILGGKMTEATRNRIGYLPEDRGLYRNVKLLDCLVYFGMLKGLTKHTARQRADDYLERFDLMEHRKKKVNDLSRGMQQKAQFIITLLHTPDLMVVDEPFAGFDPVNVQIIMDMLREQAAAGKTIILSAHEMHLVQELAERMVMINHGEVVLYGKIAELRRTFAENAVLIEGQGILSTPPGVVRVEPTSNHRRTILHLADAVSPQDIIRHINNDEQFTLEYFELAMPSLNEIFVRVAKTKSP